MDLSKGIGIYLACLAGGVIVGGLAGHFVAQAIIK